MVEDSYKDGASITVTANGFLVRPPSGPEYGRFCGANEMYVFRNSAELSAWLMKVYPEGAA